MVLIMHDNKKLAKILVKTLVSDIRALSEIYVKHYWPQLRGYFLM